MIYSEKFSGVNGIVRNLKSNDSEKFNAVFGESFNDSLLDDYINFMNGDFDLTIGTEIIVSKHEDYAVFIASMIWLKFYDSWKRISDTLKITDNPIETYSISRTETRKTENLENDVSSSDSVNKVSAFNSEAFNNDNSQADNSTSEKNITGNETIEHSEKGNTSGKTASELKQTAISFERENIFIDIITSDIVSLLCRGIA